MYTRIIMEYTNLPRLLYRLCIVIPLHSGRPWDQEIWTLYKGDFYGEEPVALLQLARISGKWSLSEESLY